MPEEAIESPEIFVDLEWVWEAFCVLSRKRQVGNAVGGIPLVEIRSWMDEMGIRDTDDRNDFLTIIEFLDATFVEHCNQKLQEAARKKK